MKLHGCDRICPNFYNLPYKSISLEFVSGRGFSQADKLTFHPGSAPAKTPSGAKAPIIGNCFAARLKTCPDTNRASTEFTRSCPIALVCPLGHEHAEERNYLVPTTGYWLLTTDNWQPATDNGQLPHCNPACASISRNCRRVRMSIDCATSFPSRS